MTRAVCVFSASSDNTLPAYTGAASELGRLIGERRWGLVFGGGMCGLMGHVARAVHDAGGHVTGIIPEKLNRRGIAYEAADELIVTETLRERKDAMDRRSDAFIALPGGFGTLEEIIEAMTLKQLRYHARPVVFINTLGFYDKLFAFFDHAIEEGFVRAEYRDLFHVAGDPADAIGFIENFQAARIPDKFADTPNVPS